MRPHGQRALERQVLRLHAEGWRHSIIASMAQCRLGEVRQILKDHGLLMKGQ